MTVTLPIRTQSEANMREHWGRKAARARSQRHDAALCLAASGLRPTLPAIVTLTRIAPLRLDDDNLAGSLKAVRDQVAVWMGLPTTKQGIADDRDARVTWRYAQERGGVRQYAVRVEITEGAACPTCGRAA